MSKEEEEKSSRQHAAWILIGIGFVMILAARFVEPAGVAAVMLPAIGGYIVGLAAASGE